MCIPCTGLTEVLVCVIMASLESKRLSTAVETVDYKHITVVRAKSLLQANIYKMFKNGMYRPTSHTSGYQANKNDMFLISFSKMCDWMQMYAVYHYSKL